MTSACIHVPAGQWGGGRASARQARARTERSAVVTLVTHSMAGQRTCMHASCGRPCWCIIVIIRPCHNNHRRRHYRLQPSYNMCWTTYRCCWAQGFQVTRRTVSGTGHNEARAHASLPPPAGRHRVAGRQKKRNSVPVKRMGGGNGSPLVWPPSPAQQTAQAGSRPTSQCSAPQSLLMHVPADAHACS